MIFQGYIIRINETDLKAIFNLMSNISNNINQIAMRVNRTDKAYKEDLDKD